ncbi:hypothetical protein HHI36_021048 [Cryptolaemus montrouzieri]|uniref:Uncharacterized protein n=1 Tax=Cryptolaemus montrouzieri TaxID=559131 RepID=A0ABD2MVN3_9CUCU
MKYKQWIFIPILQVCLFSLLEAQNQPILCSHCTCTPSTGSYVNADCSNNVSSVLYTTSKNTSDNTSAESNDLIQKLSVRKNELITLKDKFPFANLEVLDLSQNKIVHIEDNVFSKLQKLQTLILSKNNIEKLDPNAFQGEYAPEEFLPLRALRTIMLDRNNLHSLNANLFEHTEKIESLSLAYNPLEVIDQHTAIAITNLIHLKFLDLSYTQISVLPQYFLHTPRYITVLNMSGNNFVHVPMELEEAHALETFIFNDNPVVNLTHKNGFPEIPTLRVLHLCQMPELTEIGAGSLANLTKLEELYVAGNPKLARIDDGALASTDRTGGTYEVWPSIKKLYLNDNQLSYMNKSFLAQWDSLAELDLLDNPWTCECENQWMVDTLMPIYMKIDKEKAEDMKCGAPVEMVSFTFHELFAKNYRMRCLDLYGARPEEDAVLMIGMLTGILIGIPIVLLCLYSYKRHWFGIFDDSPAAFSRQFYGRTGGDVYDY